MSCGTKRAYLEHRAKGEDCEVCRAASAQRRRESRRRAGIKARRTPRHGTVSGQKRHYNLGEKPCRACNDAWNDYQRAYRAGESISKVHDRVGIPDLILDVLETFGYPMTSDQLADHVLRIRPQFKRESVRSIASRMEGDGRLVVKEQRIEGTNRIYLYWMP